MTDQPACLICGHPGSLHTTLVGPGCTSPECGCTNATMGQTQHAVPRADYEHLLDQLRHAATTLAADLAALPDPTWPGAAQAYRATIDAVHAALQHAMQGVNERQR